MIDVVISVRISKRPISVDSVLRSVRSDKAGGTVVFIGSVRNVSAGERVTGLELEAADDLAIADLRRIAGLAQSRFETIRLSVVHRVGKLKVGDTIVVIAVSAPHRKNAFSACRFVIDELKRTTPLWKKEQRGRRGHWIEPEG